MSKYALVVLLSLFMTSLIVAQEKRLKEDITCEEAIQLIHTHESDSAFVILDVRTPDEFNAGHLRNAVNMDFRSPNFAANLEKLDRTKTYLVYCRKGGRSSSAIGIMNDLKFKALYHLFEGYDVWESKGHAIIQGPSL